MSRKVNISNVEAALKQAAKVAQSGSKDAKSGRFRIVRDAKTGRLVIAKKLSEKGTQTPTSVA